VIVFLRVWAFVLVALRSRHLASSFRSKLEPGILGEPSFLWRPFVRTETAVSFLRVADTARGLPKVLFQE
jgi:hypothetical protein